MEVDGMVESEFALEKAAQATEKFVMIPELAEEFARVIEEYRQALMWCSASMDYQINGKARKGWEAICEPLLR